MCRVARKWYTYSTVYSVGHMWAVRGWNASPCCLPVQVSSVLSQLEYLNHIVAFANAYLMSHHDNALAIILAHQLGRCASSVKYACAHTYSTMYKGVIQGVNPQCKPERESCFCSWSMLYFRYSPLRAIPIAVVTLCTHFLRSTSWVAVMLSTALQSRKT